MAGSDPHYNGRAACQRQPVKLAHYMFWSGVSFAFAECERKLRLLLQGDVKRFYRCKYFMLGKAQ